MKTITFYSYKGGVGRTLLLANVAKYLCRFGQKVFALDFDLEAPGLHYKLIPGESPEAVSKLGAVDYIYSFAVEDRPRPESLSEYVVEVERNENVGGLIHLMRAGNVPTAEYWRRLARINWHDVFYSDGARGVPFFLELKAKIEKEFSPDYLLIDSRTGITEIGGVATTILPEVIVCLLLNNRENLDGAREVLRSIRRTRRQRNQPPAIILPVVARLPASEESNEAEVLETVRDFLNEDAPEIEDNLSFSELLVLHTEPRLEVKETLLIDSGTSSDSLLFRDYIHVLAKVVPAQVLMPT
ncbi:MAG TPA: AAA family ATPase [Bryobacteraceae bacterium]|nr:AAA family ATPase [Bryobacteraceae bacterium]